MSRRKQENPKPRKRLINAETELLQDTLTCGSCQKVFLLSEIVKFIQHKVHSCNKENNFIVLEDGSPDFDSDNEEPPIAQTPVVGHTRTPISAPMCNRKGLNSQHHHLRNRIRTEKPVLPTLAKSPPEPASTPPLSLTVERCTTDNDNSRTVGGTSIFGRAKAEKQEPREEADHYEDQGKKKMKEEVVIKLEKEATTLRAANKLMVDAEVNTIITEPSTYTCSTCKQAFPSAWTLVQHAQHMHGMKIYLVTPYPGSGSRGMNQPSSLPPPPTSAPPPSLIPGSSGGLGLPLPPVLPPSSMNGPSHAHSHHVLPQQSLALENHPALQLLRMPLGDRQFPPASLNAPSIFARPSSQDFRVDLLSNSSTVGNNGEGQFHRMNHHHHGPHNVPLPPLGIGPFDHQNPFTDRGPLGLDARTRPPSMGLSFEPQMDFYSQRLRQLAGATSPTMAPSPRKLTPPFTHPPMSSSSQPSTPTSTPQPPLNLHPGRSLTPSSSQHLNQVQGSSASSTSSKGGGADLQDESNKLLKTWSCEFCNKSFRFQSNLIVHRRCHTGEKPYKCPICRHSCSQASKLKRHMKTHQNNVKSRTENNTGESPRSTPDSTSEVKNEQARRRRARTPMEDEDGSDGQTADNEEEEEELDDDDDEEEELDDDLDDSSEVMMAEDLSTKGPAGSTPTSRGSPADQPKNKHSNNFNSENNGSKSPGTSENGGNDTATKENDKSLLRHSLISEVMDKIGLSNIQQYHEAYQKALEESGVKSVSSNKSEKSASSEGEKNSSNHGVIENGPSGMKREEENNNSNSNYSNHRGFSGNKSSGSHAMDLVPSLFGAFDHSHHHPHNAFDSNKRPKLDIGDPLRNTDRESLYAGLWMPSVQATHRDIFSGGNDTADLPRLEKSSSSESALKSIIPTSLACRSNSPRPGTSGNNIGTSTMAVVPYSNSKNTSKEQRRNDTCEFCGKVFKNCSNLTVHRRSHTGEKPYKCELCSYACAQSSKLTRHMKTHGRLGKDVYRCRFCDMPFSVPSTLEKHMRKCVVNQNTPALTYVDRDSDSKDIA